MKIGIPKEVKNHEYRVGATPTLVKLLVEAGHLVTVEAKAGEAIGFDDDLYKKMGAKIVQTAREVYESELIIKVKELQEDEFSLLQPGQILFCYLHLAPDPKQTAKLLEKKVVAIAYDTVTHSNGTLPLLVPMSEIAGRMSVQVGANCLQLNRRRSGSFAR